MKTILNIFRAVVGLVFIFVFHIPKLIWRILDLSYAAVFNNEKNLTADPYEHLQRAICLLRRDNSHLLYAALEIRLALERMSDREIEFASKAANRVLKKKDPVKKTSYLHVLNEAAKYPHKVLLRNQQTGEVFDFGEYKPLDLARVTEIKGRTGNLLHLMHSIPYGISDSPWYKETRQFLRESAKYLLERCQDSTPFFAYENLDHIELIKKTDVGRDFVVCKDANDMFDKLGI